MMQTHFTGGQPNEQLRLTHTLSKPQPGAKVMAKRKISDIMPGRRTAGAERLTAS